MAANAAARGAEASDEVDQVGGRSVPGAVRHRVRPPRPSVVSTGSTTRGSTAQAVRGLDGLDHPGPSVVSTGSTTRAVRGLDGLDHPGSSWRSPGSSVPAGSWLCSAATERATDIVGAPAPSLATRGHGGMLNEAIRRSCKASGGWGHLPADAQRVYFQQ